MVIAIKSNPVVFLSAGEASGDHYGAELIRELKRRVAGGSFFGLGGTEMEAAGLSRIVKAEDVAVMGITEILRHIPRIYLSYRKLVGSIKRQQPDVAVLIDFPDVNFRLAKHCKRLGIPVVWFVSPQLWAWKRQRLRWVQKRVSRMLVIFPFEAAFYKARGVDAEFVGHPLASLPLPDDNRLQFAGRNHLCNPEHSESGKHLFQPWIALLPGSRWKEVAANLPTMLEAAAALGAGYDFLIPVASTLEFGEFSDFVFQQTLPRIKWPKGSSITLVTDAREALHHAQASVVASGTATVQALVIGNPFIVVYRVSRTTFALAKRLVKYPVEIPAPVDEVGNLPIAMVNLIAGKRIVPELINERFTAHGVASALKPLLVDGVARKTMIADLAEARRSLFADGEETPVQRVANAVLGVLRMH